eukprot:Nk52_evm8s147 gene=Nk52_evmTU8s147
MSAGFVPGGNFGLSVADEEDAAELKFGKEYQNVPCMLTAEVQFLLEARKEAYERAVSSGNDDGDEQKLALSHVFNQTFDYVKTVSKYRNKESVRELRNLLIKKNFHEYEIAALANLCPDTAEEAKALIPSLDVRFEDDDLQETLDDIKNLRDFQ